MCVCVQICGGFSSSCRWSLWVWWFWAVCSGSARVCVGVSRRRSSSASFTCSQVRVHLDSRGLFLLYLQTCICTSSLFCWFLSLRPVFSGHRLLFPGWNGPAAPRVRVARSRGRHFGLVSVSGAHRISSAHDGRRAADVGGSQSQSELRPHDGVQSRLNHGSADRLDQIGVE